MGHAIVLQLGTVNLHACMHRMLLMVHLLVNTCLCLRTLIWEGGMIRLETLI